MSHELLHFWNGLTIVPTDWHEEWFKEGVTDYLTIVTLARNGLIDETLVVQAPGKRAAPLSHRPPCARSWA